MFLKWSRPAVTLTAHRIVLKGSSQKTFQLIHASNTVASSRGETEVSRGYPGPVQMYRCTIQQGPDKTRQNSQTWQSSEGISYELKLLCSRKCLFSWHEIWIKHLPALLYVCVCEDGGFLSVSLTTIHQYWHLLPLNISAPQSSISEWKEGKASLACL